MRDYMPSVKREKINKDIEKKKLKNKDNKKIELLPCISYTAIMMYITITYVFQCPLHIFNFLIGGFQEIQWIVPKV